MEERLISYDYRVTVFKNYIHVSTCCDAAFGSCVIQLLNGNLILTELTLLCFVWHKERLNRCAI